MTDVSLRAYLAPARWPDRWLAEAAVRRGLPGTLDLCEHDDARTAWEALLAAGIAEGSILELACSVSATKPVDLEPVGTENAVLLSRALAERYAVVPVRMEGSTLVVATSDPLSATLERDLAFATRRRVSIVTAPPAALAAARARCYAGFVDDEAGAPALVTPREPGDEYDGARSAIADLIDMLIQQALREGASDLHFEPTGDGLLVRFRVDGALHEARRVPAAQAPQVVRRVKVLAGMDIADTLRPQDGRLAVQFQERSIDLRISTLPLGGLSEKVVMRVLDSRVAQRELAAVGFTSRELSKVQRLLEQPEGLLLVTGPTGSGKTSTLYAAVRHLHRPDLNIVTVEDPIEYRIDGISQVQVNDRARMTFAASLRSILRQDPDVVLVGEMRDAETAQIAVKASLTGHLVLSTLHASDAPSTLDRLYGMDIDTGALAAALKGIVGQRLVRTLCDACAQPVTLAELPMHQQALLSGRSTEKLRRPVGCPACRGTGYRGRTIVTEIFLVTPLVQRAIARRADLGELRELARDCGTISMWESGLERVLAGRTSLFELLDNVAAPVVETPDVNPQADVDALLAQLLAQPVTHPAPVRPQLPDIPVLPPSGSDFLRRIDAGDGASRTVQAASPVGTRAPLSPHASPPRVLVVDETRAERRVVAEPLLADGMVVLEAADGEQALAYARRLRPDVIVTELTLPKLDAVGLLQAIAAEQLAIRVLVRTRQTDEPLLQWVAELGGEVVRADEVVTVVRGG
ncbi:MAG TPA: type II/IV secretion system protein [Gemmatimonadaceae bacterium]|jgi:type IV pilus assembly protein PilB|nr:type II/IV secretion system protein [Gemmatimonadaceae bacterium]